MDIINAGTNEDGTPHLHYHAPGEHVVLTPPDMTGTITLGNGTEVDVTDRVIVVDSVEQAEEIVTQIASVYEPAPTDTAEEA